MTNTPSERPAAVPKNVHLPCGGGRPACGEAGEQMAASEATTHRLCEFGVDDVWVLLPFILFDPHLHYVSASCTMSSP